MKKIYTIGREEGCDIVIPDSSDVISRLHATIRIDSENKIYITDQSRNGTYVNGIKISSNVEVPVSRKDVISFAHIVDFNWSLIPKQRSKYLKWAIVISSFIVIVGFVAYFAITPGKPTDSPTPIMENHTEISKDINRQDSIIQDDTVKSKSNTREPVKVQTPPSKDKEEDSVIVENPEEEIYNPIY